MVLALQELEPIELAGPIEMGFSNASCWRASCNK